MGSPGRRIVGPLPRETEGIEISQRVVSTLSQRAPLTVLRGPRGFGKTSTIVQWLNTGEGPATVIYVPLGTEERDADRFWRLLADRLTKAGARLDDDDPRRACLQTLYGWGEPLLLVLDNFHEAGLVDGAEGIDHDLIELLRANVHLELIVAGRSLRTLETTGALSVDSHVVRPRDLALDVFDVLRLAALRGVEISHDEAAQLVAELGGWPAAVRGCLQAAGAQGAAGVDSMLVDGYITSMLEDINSIELRDFLLRTSVPEEFSAPALSAIAPGDRALAHLRSLRTAGLVQHRRTVAGSRFAYPPAIRESLLRYVRENRPELVREVHLAMLPLAASEGGPAAALSHAIAAQEWSTALSLLEEEWVPLVSHHRGLLGELVTRFPAELVAAHPRLQVIAGGMGGMPRDGHADTGWRVRQPAFLVSVVEARTRETGVPVGEDRVSMMFQAGAAALLTGDNDSAAYAFGAVREAGVADDDATARLMGAMGSQLSHAILGDAAAAASWSNDAELAEVMAEPGEGVRRLVGVGARIAQALAAVDMMNPTASEAVARILEPPQRDEVWAAAVAVRAMHATVVADDELLARRAREVRSAMRYIKPDAITSITLGGVLVQLQLVTGMPHAAAQVLERLPDAADLLPTRALWQARSGAWGEALRSTEDLHERRDLTQRARLLGEVVRVWALHTQGKHTSAEECFRRAAHIAWESGQRRAFHLVPARVLRAVGGSAVEELCPGLGDPGLNGESGSHSTFTEEGSALSPREVDVLTALHEHAGPTGISRSLGISANTVKTHLRNIYRKLGASGRDEALRLGGHPRRGRHG